MRKIGKALAVAATVIGIGGIGLAAVGQPAGAGYGPGGYGPMGSGGPGFMAGRGGPGMMGGWGGPGAMGGWRGTGFADPSARLAALKTELGIRPEQTAAWDGYAKAVQDGVAQVQAMREAMFNSMGTQSWQEHQALMAKLFDQRAQAFKTVQAAATTLTAALDDTQKTRALLPELTAMGSGMMGWGGGAGPMGFGGGMMGWGPGGGAR